MADRKNLQVNTTHPKTILDLTAVGAKTALSTGMWVSTKDLDAAIVAAGGDVRRRSDAIKGLRNEGSVIASVRARHKSRYRLNANSKDLEAWRNRTVRDAYSQFVTTARTLAGAVLGAANDPILRAAHTAAQGAAIQLGQAQGISLTQIVADLQPI